MLKISEAGSHNHAVTLSLEGRVLGPWVDELRRICESVLAENKSLTLDLGKVSYVDAEGVTTLNSLKARGVSLNQCSPFVEQQIKSAI